MSKSPATHWRALQQKKEQLKRKWKPSRFSVSIFLEKAKTWVKTHPRKTIVIGVVIIFIASILYTLRDLPSPSKLKSDQAFSVSTQIFDRNGVLLYDIFSDQNRTPIALKDLPPYVAQASISIEDQHFYQHIGFDLSGMLRGLKNTILGQDVQGGSTITQQLIKTALLSRQKTITRKLKEGVLAVATEMVYSKQEILEMYLNYIPYGGTAWGIEEASQTYFNKHAKNLDIAEAALLAGLPQSPSRYSPFGINPDLAIQRQHEVLRRMREDGYITKDQEQAALNEKLQFAAPSKNIKAPHFVMYIKDQLVDMYGDARVERGGLRVYTTLDWNIQEAAQASLSAEINKLARYKVGNGAALVTKPNTGEILAMIGSRDYYDATHDGQVNVTQRLRQPGSSIKPINVTTAFQLKKATPATMLLDIQTCFDVPGQPEYCPRNYDGSFHGPVQTRFFLGNSYNIPEVKLLALNTIPSMVATASAMGISTWTDPSKYGLSLTLGGGEVKMVDMAVAFGTIANQGLKVPLHSILKIEDYKGNKLEEYIPETTADTVKAMTQHVDEKKRDEVVRVLDREPTYLVSHILLDNNARAGAFGASSQLVIPNQVVSVKTGTTNDLKDNWTIGYTPDYLTAVWVGNNDNTPMNPYLVSGITGAAPIWHNIMGFVLRGKKAIWPDVPKDITNANICITTGLLPDPNNPCQTRSEFFWKGTEPTTIEQTQQDVQIVPATNFPFKVGDSIDGLRTEKHTMLSDPFTQNYCLDCTRPLDAQGKTVYEQYKVDMSTWPNVPTTPQP